MIDHSAITILLVAAETDAALGSLVSYLEAAVNVQTLVRPGLPRDLAPFDVVVTTRTAERQGSFQQLEQFARAGGGWLGLVDALQQPLPPVFGARPTPPGPDGELRVMFQKHGHPLAVRLPDAVYVRGRCQMLEPEADDAEVILYADWHYQHRSVLIGRPAGRGYVACTTLQAYDHPGLRQMLYRLICRLGGRRPPDRTMGVGILGYAPSVGRYHGIGADKTPGLALRAVCDLSPERLEQAGRDFSQLKTCSSADELVRDPEVDVVIVATAPNIHARLCLDMMAAGKHVVCEKPLALSSRETRLLREMSEKMKVHLGCHQNRRWDVDYLAIRKALSRGAVGELFHMETFVGGFKHPCGYWHSHAGVSGGTAYDWGGHYIDWIVSLVPDKPVSVTCASHKRVWYDVTNNDQERIQVRFEGGQEAEFMHSDIAAIRKPKWYLLGTEGAILGRWQDVSTYEIDPVLYFHRHDIPPTEMPPELVLTRQDSESGPVFQKLPLPERQDYMFHRNLADHLLTGEPVEAPLEDSIAVVAILEAASRSAAGGGCEVPIDG